MKTRREIVWVGVAALLLLFGVIGLDGGGPLLIVGLIVVGALLIGVGIKRSRQEGADKPRLSVVTEAPAPKPSRSLPSITLDDPACPYCGAVQDPPPQRRRKCRDCGETIHTRTDQETRKRYLITATEADRLHRQQREERWKELSKAVEVASRAGDLNALAAAYVQQSYFLFGDGRPHQRVAQDAARCRLLHFQQTGVPKVSVMTSQDERVCEYCRSLEGKVFTVAEALRTMPLPGPGCDDGMCRCVYNPELG